MSYELCYSFYSKIMNPFQLFVLGNINKTYNRKNQVQKKYFITW